MDPENDLQEFYDHWKETIWLIKIEYSMGVQNIQSYITGFALNSNGLVMTCTHSFPKTSYTMSARRLEDNFFFECEMIYEKRKWDITLVHIKNVNDCKFGRLTNDGSLSVGQILFHIGNPHNFVGSFLIGKVSFQCVDDVDIPVDSRICRDYESTALSTTPRYRVIGDIWNEMAFCNFPSKEKKIEKNLHPCVPII
ncbi:hypothetical protein Cni_G11597 [Canna indica]|uniref:Uncharacterized protein n=1 Tax=Canna indica TaxID=4628 RepID=A0AAQ3QBD5_9LILI|nr:hypothetical protein Cni_G11597 [Canna indica]